MLTAVSSYNNQPPYKFYTLEGAGINMFKNRSSTANIYFNNVNGLIKIFPFAYFTMLCLVETRIGIDLIFKFLTF